MKTTWKYLQKAAALTLAAIFLSVPLSSAALAAAVPQNQVVQLQNEQTQKLELKADQKKAPKKDNKDRKDPKPKKHKKHHKDHDDNGNAITGFIIGAAVGAVVAKNT